MQYSIQQGMSTSVAVVEAVSEFEGCEPTELPRLSTVIEPDALDNLFVATDRGRLDRNGELSFAFSNSRVTIEDGETITVERKQTKRMSA